MNVQPWWVDATLIVISILYMIDGYRRGFLLVFVEVIGFFISLVAALFGYAWAAKGILRFWEIPHSFANAIAFFALWIVIGLLYPMLARQIYKRIPVHLTEHKWNQYLGFLPALADAFVLAAVILPLLVALPLSSPIKNSVLKSKIGAPIARFSQALDNRIEAIFSPAVRDSLAFLTVHPKSDETVSLRFKTANHTVDEEAETEMFKLVNEERLKRGLPAVTFDSSLRALARDYGETMVEGGFFSHHGQDGSTPATRADRMQIRYRVLGENLAFAPDTAYAHDGLMNSEGHRANILSRDFGKLGVGVIDAGIYGKMFVQEFSN